MRGVSGHRGSGHEEPTTDQRQEGGQRYAKTGSRPFRQSTSQEQLQTPTTAHTPVASKHNGNPPAQKKATFNTRRTPVKGPRKDSEVMRLFKYASYQPPPKSFRLKHSARPAQDKSPPQLKEKIWQTACRVYIETPQVSMTESAFQDEVRLDWRRVLAVEILGEPVTCPVCLEKAITCPRVTKCGHVYCWICLLRFFEAESLLHDKPASYWGRCPLCSDGISKEELRCARYRPNSPLDKEKWTFVLVQRFKDRTSVECPIAKNWQLSYTPFDRLISTSDCLRFWEPEFRCLLFKRRLCLEFGHSPESLSCIMEALEALEVCLRQRGLGEHVSRLEDEAMHTFERLQEEHPFFAPWEILELAASQCFPTGASEELWKQQMEKSKLPILESCGDSSGETSLTVKDISDSLCSSNSYYFYQSWDGQLVFLAPLFLKMFLHQGDGNFLNLIPLIPDVRILCSSTFILDRDTIRSRYPFLSHLPLGLAVRVCDIDPIALLNERTRTVFAVQLQSCWKKYKNDEKRKIQVEKRYEQIMKHKVTEEVGVLDFESREERVNELNLKSNFPELESGGSVFGVPTPPVQVHPISSSSAPAMNFRDRVLEGCDLIQNETNYPALKAAQQSKVIDPMSRNWRRGLQIREPGLPSRPKVEYINASTSIASMRSRNVQRRRSSSVDSTSSGFIQFRKGRGQ